MKKVFFFLLLICVEVKAQTADNPAPALNFLKIEPDGRGSALGLTGAATEPDNFSIFYNPGKLAMMPSYEYGLSASYVPWVSNLVKGVGMASAQGFRRLDDQSAIGLDLRFFSLGKINFKDETGYDIYSYNPTEYSIGITYSAQLSDYAAVGISFRYINSRPALGIPYAGVEIKSASAIGGDIGYYYCNIPAGELENYAGGIFRGGLVLQNLGSKVKYHNASYAAFQPMNLKAGVSYTLPSQAAEHFFTISADINKLLVPGEPVRDEDGRIISGKDPVSTSVPAALIESWKYSKSLGAGIGIEYNYRYNFFLRAGMYYEHPDFSPKQLGTFGIGFRKGIFHVDMSYFTGLNQKTGANYQSQTFKISLGLQMTRQ